MAVFSFVFFATLNRIEMERKRGKDEAKSGLSPDQLVTLADLRSVQDELLAAITKTGGSSQILQRNGLNRMR
jgi:hypothetical protein